MMITILWICLYGYDGDSDRSLDGDAMEKSGEGAAQTC